MRILLAILLSAVSATASVITNAQGFLIVSNPPPVEGFAWTAPQTTNVITNYWIYYGVTTQGYTNRVSMGNTTTGSIQFSSALRGWKLYCAATAQDNQGLESIFSNEINFSIAIAPSPPGLQPPFTIIAQSKPLDGDWSDDFAWNTAPDTNTLYRLRIEMVDNPSPTPKLFHPTTVDLPPTPK